MNLLILLIFLCLHHSLATTPTTNIPQQLQALVSLKSSLIDPMNTLQDWDTSPPLPNPGLEPVWCKWSGIKCEPNTFLINTLDISNRNLSGSIPDNITYLTHLHHLNISVNAFAGPLPPAIFNLTLLRTLDINHNFFNSTFPLGMKKLKLLTYFNAYSNNFTGPLPDECARLEFLQHLNFGGSYFEGEVPKSYGGFKSLKFMYLAGNTLTGAVPAELGLITSLLHLEIGYNDFTGGIPPEFATLANLTFIDVSSAGLSGGFPTALTYLTGLNTLLIFKNNLTGEIPKSIKNLHNLKTLDLSDNTFFGNIPHELALLKNLKVLSLLNNEFTGEVPEGIGELPALELLFLWNNSLAGTLPQKLGLNSNLQRLDVSSNSFSGPVPPNLCRGGKLTKLILFSNKFSGSLPISLATCASLVRLRVQCNALNGSIPIGFGKLPNITFMELSNNDFTGLIPSDLANAAKLEYLNISENAFGSHLPDKIWSAPSLQILSASASKLTGRIPSFKGCENFYKIELESNDLTDSIPWDIGHCMKLISLNLRHNSLTGIIPWEITTLPSITEVDLSYNLLTGTISVTFGNCSTLEAFNVSYNQLTGPIPSFGPAFSSLHPSSFVGNEGLCGGVLEKEKPCASGVEIEVKQKPKRTDGTVMWILAAAFCLGMVVLITGGRCLHASCKSGRFVEDREIGPWKLTAFQRLNFTAEDVVECVSMTDKIIGMGSTGTVYKAEMPSGEIIAVKKLWGKHKETIRRLRGVLAEVDVLGNVRHRNIVRLLGCCSNLDCTMLLYEYMPNGSLDDLLHGKNKGDNLMADWATRYKIALGVAQGICYLHHDCDPVIVHRDLKPSNILLDGEMEARVADFGVAKLIQCDESMSVIAGSYGYIAPEYAYTLQVDEKSDIYSFGVVLMEIISGKTSVNSEFGDGNSIVDWVRSKMKNREGIKDVLDKDAGALCSLVREEMMLVLRVALLCTSRNPTDRPSMRDVVSMLLEAKPKRKSPEKGGGRMVGNGGAKPPPPPPSQKATIEC
ncbi:uncharacterized protein LOC143547991 [Bidens hawaiensis]|uniref:uncharacterized protein LOC143547991 n=1 Tax=Bidens hawaiensis TaxID=980011 RepID=UPI00404B7855